MNEFRVYTPAELGRDGYPHEWHETIKHAVREAAGHRCIRCHHPYTVKREGNLTTTSGFQVQVDDEWINVSRCDEFCTHGPPTILLVADGSTVAPWRILTVHHLDGDKANCRWWNLVSLCQRCHLRVQRVVVMPRVWPWEHSEWFRPYVAGYYASVYLDEELTRDEVEARLDELLGLERAA